MRIARLALALLAVAAPAAAQVREPASGTAWDPSAPEEHAAHEPRDGWGLDLHGQATLYRADEGGERGDDQWGSTNWLMAAAVRPRADGTLRLRGMISLEPLTVGGCGTPNLLQTGEICDGEAIVDAQHPHELFTEISADYARRLGLGVAADLYVAAVGAPALGPASFPHRGSASAIPVSPITHHWIDATHIAFGVLTLGIEGRGWRVDASRFNGREPDDDRLDFDFAPLRSYAARIQIALTDRFVLQVSRGRLRDAHRHIVLLPPELVCPAAAGACHLLPTPDPLLDVTRTTASASYLHPMADGRSWSVTAAWGRNDEEAHVDTDGALVEGRFDLPGGVLFGRAERVTKSDHDLAIQPTLLQFQNGEQRTFDLTKLVLGYAREVGAAAGIAARAGAALSWSRLPASLEDRYGERTPIGVTLFASFGPRPAHGPHGELY